MRDPGHISDAAWNQEAPYRDADGVDLEHDQRWDHVAGSDFVPRESFLPTRGPRLGVVPAPTARRGTSSQDASAPPAGASNPL